MEFNRRKNSKNKMDMILSYPEYLIKGVKIINIIQDKNLSSLLAQNGILTLDEELNNERILKGKKLNSK